MGAGSSSSARCANGCNCAPYSAFSCSSNTNNDNDDDDDDKSVSQLRGGRLVLRRRLIAPVLHAVAPPPRLRRPLHGRREESSDGVHRDLGALARAKRLAAGKTATAAAAAAAAAAGAAAAVAEHTGAVVGTGGTGSVTSLTLSGGFAFWN